MSAKKEIVYFGQVLLSKANKPYYRQSNLEGFMATTDQGELEISPSEALAVRDLSDIDDGADKFVSKGISFNEKIGEDDMGKPQYKSVRLFNIVEKKDGSKAGKVACDQIIAFRDGKKIKFVKGDWVNLTTKEDRLERAAIYKEKGYYSDEEYADRVAKIERTPDFVLANLSGKGELV